MSFFYTRCAGRALTCAALSGIIVGLGTSSTFAACTLPTGTTAGSCDYSDTGPGLTITASGTGTPVPVAIEGVSSGAGGRAIRGRADAPGGIGGSFVSAAPEGNANNTGVFAENTGGSQTTEGNYGSAGIFQITNVQNKSPGVSIMTSGINSYALSVVDTGVTDFTDCLPGLLNGPGACGGVAGFFAITSVNAIEGQSAIFALNSPAAPRWSRATTATLRSSRSATLKISAARS